MRKAVVKLIPTILFLKLLKPYELHVTNVYCTDFMPNKSVLTIRVKYKF